MISQERLDLRIRQIDFQLVGIKTALAILESIKYDMKRDGDIMKQINDTLKDLRQIE